MRVFIFFILTSLIEPVITCSYCASQDPSLTLNIALIPLGFLVTLPFGLFGLFILYFKKYHNIE